MGAVRMMPNRHPDLGWIEVITGCMFSGKTEELIRRLVRARYGKQRVVVFKPATDTRYAVTEIVTHSKVKLPCVPVQNASDILTRIGDAQVIGIDEAQFFEGDLVDVAEELANRGYRVVVAGLDQDFSGTPFEPMPQLLAVAEYITKNLACCMVCGAPADRSQRMVAQENQVMLGAEDTYEARCRRHWNPNTFESQQEILPLENS